jgi:hypothetical protein
MRLLGMKQIDHVIASGGIGGDGRIKHRKPGYRGPMAHTWATLRLEAGAECPSPFITACSASLRINSASGWPCSGCDLACGCSVKPRTILIEDASTGTALAQEQKTAHFGGAVGLVPVERDKRGRLYVHQAKFEAGLVHFPKNAPFLAGLEAELLTFPQGKHDDQVDSISQALNFKTGYTLDHVR